MRLPSTIRFVDSKIQQALYKLEKGDSSERELFKVINQAMDNLEENAYYGIQIQKAKFPKEYIKKYNINNLWKYDLPQGWRIIYTIRRDKVIVVSLILEWLNHKEYEKRFNY